MDLIRPWSAKGWVIPPLAQKYFVWQFLNYWFERRSFEYSPRLDCYRHCRKPMAVRRSLRSGFLGLAKPRRQPQGFVRSCFPFAASVDAVLLL